MEFRGVFKRKHSLLLAGTIILYFRVSEELGTDCQPSTSRFSGLNGECCNSYSYCRGMVNECGGDLAKKYCNITDPTVVCPVTDLPWFMCLDKKRCYPRQLRCNRQENCYDGSDEIGCDAEPMKATEVFNVMKSLTRFLLNTEFSHPVNKSGPHLTKIALALSSTDRRLLKPNTKTRDEIAHELSLRLLTKLTLEKKLSTYELSDYINALIVTCINPRDFFGFNLVAELRKRVNQSNYMNPYAVLALCNARTTMLQEDVNKLQNLFYAHRRPLWAGTQSLITMTLACISSHSSLQIEKSIIPEMVKELKRKQLNNGAVESLRNTALVVQALLATDSYQTDFDVHGAVKLMVEKAHFNDDVVRPRKPPEVDFPVNLLDIYYILPVLNHMSLVDISSDHCTGDNELVLGETKNLQDFPDKYIVVQFSIYVGEEKDFVKTWKLNVPETCNLYHILEIVSLLEPKYKVNYIVSDLKPYVNSIGEFIEDPEVEEFWFIYKKPLSPEGNLTLHLKQSPVDVQVKATEELILWFKTRDWYKSIGTPN